MSTRSLIIGILIVLCVGAVGGISIQHRQLTNLRADYQQVLAKLSEPSDALADSAAGPSAPTTSADASDGSPPLELLQLRSQVSRLTARKRELSNVSAEYERLKQQLASRNTNAPAGKPLPPDYIRKSQAQWAGFSTPENTVQSFLWAVHHQDLTNMLQALTPNAAAEMMQGFRRAPDQFFQQASILPGLRITNLRQLTDVSFEAQMEIVPGEPVPEPVRFLLIDGQWRMDLP